jgi:hypothetical protein
VPRVYREIKKNLVQLNPGVRQLLLLAGKKILIMYFNDQKWAYISGF